jgi:hypothetical protein
MQKKSKSAKKYAKPTVKRVKLEDKQVVAMAVCKTGFQDQACTDDFGRQAFQFNPS